MLTLSIVTANLVVVMIETGSDGDDKDDGGVDGDGDADSNIGNDANCTDGRNKVDCSKDT